MSHAWLFTGPPGSGRSNAAIAFAAALQCEQDPPGCGACHACHTVLAGSHADVTVVRTERLSIGVDEVRELVRRSALAPVGRRWQIIIVEDADRLTEQACNALLKAIEEPTPRTVWMLCAPDRRGRAADDPLPLPAGHPDDADRRRRRRVPGAHRRRRRRAGVVRRPRQPGPHRPGPRAGPRRGDPQPAPRGRRHPGPADLARRCMDAARRLTEVTKEEADALTTELDAREKAELDAAYGVVERGRRPREYAPALRDLEKEQKTRAKRRQLDVVDRGLMDLVSVYRDAIAVAAARAGPLVNEEIRARRRAARPGVAARDQPAADRGDLRGPRADAGVQRAAGAGAGVDDGGPGGARGEDRVKQLVVVARRRSRCCSAPVP